MRSCTRCPCRPSVFPAGGSAGLAAAVAARELGKEVTVIVPHSTGEVTRKKLEQEGAVVEVHGRVRPIPVNTGTWFISVPNT